MQVENIVILSVVGLLAVGCGFAFAQAKSQPSKEGQDGAGSSKPKHALTAQPIKDLLDAKAGCMIPDNVEPDIGGLLQYFKTNGVTWSGFNHSKDDMEPGVVDEVYLRNVTGKNANDALLVGLMKTEKEANEWLIPQENPESEKECEIAVNGRLVIQIQFLGDYANKIKKLVTSYRKP